MRPTDVATLAGVPAEEVRPATLAEVQAVLADRLPADAFSALGAAPASFWRVGDRYYFDDPEWGDVVDVADLSYDRKIGLYDSRTFPDR